MSQVLIGTYTSKLPHVDGHADGMFNFQFKDGKLSEKYETIDANENPTYVTVHSNQLIVCNEADETGKLTLFNISDGFEKKDEVECKGAPCHLLIENNTVIAANYGGGSVAAFEFSSSKFEKQLWKLEFGLEEPSDSSRQDASHCHFVKTLFQGDLLFVNDLGNNCAFVFKLKNAEHVLAQPERIAKIPLPPLAGPRHAEFHANLPIIYIVNELDNTISIVEYHYDKDKSEFKAEIKGSVKTLPSDFSGESNTAAIKISPNGKFLYASNRGHNSLAIFKIEESGKLEYIACQSTFGEVPRDFAIHPTGKWLIVANQNSDNLITYECDESSGLLNKIHENTCASPVCVLFY